jgi:hypothetical protein
LRDRRRASGGARAIETLCQLRKLFMTPETARPQCQRGFFMNQGKPAQISPIQMARWLLLGGKPSRRGMPWAAASRFTLSTFRFVFFPYLGVE